MECVDKNLNAKNIEIRIARFIAKDLNEAELEEFQLHLMECEYCHRGVLAGFEIRDAVRELAAYEEFCAAYDKENWERVIELAAEFDKLGASEEVYPRKEKVNTAIFSYIEKLEEQGGYFILKKEFGKALDCYKEAHKIAPNNIEPKVWMGAVFRLLGNLIESEKILLECEKMEPDDSETLAELGLLYMSMEKFIEAEKKFRRAYELDSCHDYAVNLSLAYLELGKSQEAEIMLEKVVKIDLDDDEGYREFLSATGRGPFDSQALLALAWAYYDNNKVKKADEIINKALELSPDDVSTLDNIGRICVRHGEFDRGLKYYEKALQIEPDSPIFNNNISFCYYLKGEINKATKYIEEAIKLAPNDFTINYNHKVLKNRKKEKPRLYFYYPLLAKAA